MNRLVRWVTVHDLRTGEKQTKFLRLDHRGHIVGEEVFEPHPHCDGGFLRTNPPTVTWTTPAAPGSLLP